MRRTIALALLAVAAAASAACAGPKFYKLDAEGREHETGIPIYPPKIFLVVSSSGAKDRPAEVTIVRVPDRSQEPIFAREIRGWGSGELTLDFEGGMLKSVGGKSDSQASDTVDALGSLLGAAGDLTKILRQQPGEPPVEFRVYELVTDTAGVRLVPVRVVP